MTRPKITPTGKRVTITLASDLEQKIKEMDEFKPLSISIDELLRASLESNRVPTESPEVVASQPKGKVQEKVSPPSPGLNSGPVRDKNGVILRYR